MNSFEGIATVAVLSVFFIELILVLRERMRRDQVIDMTVNLGIGLATLATGVMMKGVSFAVFSGVYDYAMIRPAAGPGLWLTAFFACDFVIYWYHRLGHRTRLFWAAHVTHHSSQYYNISVGFRVSFIHVFYRFIFWSPLCLLGIPPLMILFFDSLTTIHNILIHNERVGKLGWLDRIFNTPSNHRVHHASNPGYLDKNMGGILIIYDRLFGTYQPESEKPVYGITKNIHSHHPATILLHEYRHLLRELPAIRGWRQKLRYLFSPPSP